MSNSISEVASVLAKVQIATMIAKAVGIDVPPALTQFEAAASTALSGVQNFQAPTSLTADLNDASESAAALAPLLEGMSLGKIVGAVQQIPATKANLESGQIAIIRTVGASFGGTADKVVIAAYRESGAFAQIVDQGVTDANAVNPAG